MQVPPFCHGEEKHDGNLNNGKKKFIVGTNLTSRQLKKKSPYYDMEMMRSHVFVVIFSVSVLIRGQQLAPKLSICSFGGGNVYGTAQSISDTFKCAIPLVVRCEYSDPSYIQIMEVVY